MSDNNINFDLTAAQWRKNARDEKAFIEALASRLANALPHMVSVSREFKLFSKERPVKAITVTFVNAEYELTFNQQTGIKTQVGIISRGIRLNSEELDFTTWLAKVSKELADYATEHTESKKTLEQFLLSD